MCIGFVGAATTWNLVADHHKPYAAAREAIFVYPLPKGPAFNAQFLLSKRKGTCRTVMEATLQKAETTEYGGKTRMETEKKT